MGKKEKRFGGGCIDREKEGLNPPRTCITHPATSLFLAVVCVLVVFFFRLESGIESN